MATTTALSAKRRAKGSLNHGRCAGLTLQGQLLLLDPHLQCLAVGNEPILRKLTPTILICGGGIAGLCSALCLHHFGFSRIILLEQNKTFPDIGAGIQLAPNAMRILISLGLKQKLDAIAWQPAKIEIREGLNGHSLLQLPLAQSQQKWGAPYMIMHRADLINVLTETLKHRMPQTLQMNSRVHSCLNQNNKIVTVLDNGKEYTGNLLIGADGHNSCLRQLLTKITTTKPAYTALRALIPNPDPSLPSHPCIWAGDGQHAVTYALQQRTMMNFVGVVPANSKNTQSPAEQLLAFKHWDHRLLSLVEQARNLAWIHNVYEMSPPPLWHKQRLVLIGDSCHTLLPFMAQGAAMAIEDAWCLAQNLATHTALAEFQKSRQARINTIMRRSRQNARFYHARGMAGRIARAMLSRTVAKFPRLMQLDPVFGHEPETLA